jgi:tetratricopeptide (TPR) repeat protein
LPFCHQCGHNLELGIEKFCPNCGFNLQDGQVVGNTKSFEITKTKGDVFGTGFTGSGILAGKEIGYTVNGNVMNFHVSGNISKEVIDNLQKIISSPARVEPQSMDKNSIQPNEEFKTKMEEDSNTSLQIKDVLEEVNQIEKEHGTNIEEIKVGDMQISKNALSLKEIILKGNEHFYNNQYSEAIEWYDKALELDSNNFDLLFNKAYALSELNNSTESIEWYDKALEINPDYAKALNNKRLAQEKLDKEGNKGIFSRFKSTR